MSDTTARRVRVGRHKQSVATLSETIWDASDGTHMLVTVEEWERLTKRNRNKDGSIRVENILEAQGRTDDLRKCFQPLKQPEFERIICSARDELMRELGLEEVDGE